MINHRITMFSKVDNTKFGFKEKTISEAIDYIRTGDLMIYDPVVDPFSLKDITLGIRRQNDSGLQNELKARFLPAVTFNGLWDGEQICSYSSFTALDFDEIDTEEQFAQTLIYLKSLPFIVCVFRTFKQWRLKALVLHDNSDASRHEEMYEQLIDLFKSYGIDKSCKDLSRRTYLVWDEDIWVNPNCIPYNFVPSADQVSTSVVTKTNNGRKTKSPYSIINILNSSWRKKHQEFWQPGQRANSIFKCACQLCEYGVPKAMAEEYFLNGGWLSEDFTETEVLKHVHGAYNCNRDNYGRKEFI